MNFENLLKFSQKPEIFEEGTSNFWTDEYISKKMLEAHLNPDWDAASRKPGTIEKTVDWIHKNFLNKESKVLDLGCGPGLYAERLAKLGHKVTGIDFSKNSIEYAKDSCAKQGLDIDYIYQNYLELDYQEQFDLIILIYCDFGALSDEKRDVLLKKIYKALKPGGTFIFDVFTEAFKEDKQVTNEWYTSHSGFWSPEKHIVLSEVVHYPDEKVFLNQDIVLLESNKFEVYRSYDHYYSEEDLVHLLLENSFKNNQFFYDLIENSDFASNHVVFVTTEK
ncbi:MAG: hypothetical protein K0R71_2166 [Bacillales bacterium]|jgi:SAM-dependent methyltransferase|nr:hypothetical protein [Bacillales bacterium]